MGPALPTLAAATNPTIAPAAVVSQPAARKAVALTILHINDVAGETDPCG
jgi:2',3'-cyclic-nucleotide 2'-phosphodiesterase (5'-nucleotidase family)